MGTLRCPRPTSLHSGTGRGAVPRRSAGQRPLCGSASAVSDGGVLSLKAGTVFSFWHFLSQVDPGSQAICAALCVPGADTGEEQRKAAPPCFYGVDMWLFSPHFTNVDIAARRGCVKGEKHQRSSCATHTPLGVSVYKLNVVIRLHPQSGIRDTCTFSRWFPSSGPRE